VVVFFSDFASLLFFLGGGESFEVWFLVFVGAVDVEKCDMMNDFWCYV